MSGKRRVWMLVEFCLAWTIGFGAAAVVGTPVQAQGGAGTGGSGAAASIATTTVSDTIYRADGTAAGGTVLISWPAFTTAGGASVPAGSTAVTLGAGGSLSVGLVANAGSNPMGSYYTVVYHLNDGSVTREYWVVPVTAGGSAGVTVGSIRSTVLPTSVAMQTVTKSYVDQAIAAAAGGQPLDSTGYVRTSGDTMTGPLVLPGDPTAPLQASDKHYVDAQIAGVSGGSGGKVALLPQATQQVVQPVGTQLQVNELNGTEYASQYVTGTGNNGIANATASTDCANGCEVKAEQTYGSAELPSATTWNNKTHLQDARGGMKSETFENPLNPVALGQNTGESIAVNSTQSAPSVLAATGAGEIFSTGLTITENALAGGNNTFPQAVQGSVPYFKTTYSTLNMTQNNFTVGQHDMVPEVQNCYGVGDCLMGGLYMNTSGGARDDADEGAHPFDLQFSEDTRVFDGTCAGGCTTGSRTVQVAATANGGTQGEGRYLVDMNPAKVIRTGTVVSGVGSGLRQPQATFAGTNFAVSTFLEMAQTIPSQAGAIQPGTVSVPIVTSGVPAGFATNTAALPTASGVACVADVAVADGRPLNFETAAYTTMDGSHLQMTLNRPHALNATIAVGGLCGYGLEQTVDTVNGIRQVAPVIGSSTGTTLLYAGTGEVGTVGSPSAFANYNLLVASIARTNNVVTVTTAGNLPADLNGLTVTVAGVTDSSYNGSFPVTTTGPNTLTYPNTGANSTSAGGSVSYGNGSYVLYPMAEVLSVFNPTTKAVDGQMTLAANTVSWAQGDALEQPHYHQEEVGADVEFITQYAPRPTHNQTAGIFYQGNNGPGLIGWQINNKVPATNYFGNGGTHTAPSYGMSVAGVWNEAMDLQAGESSVATVHCNSHGCDNWNSAYDLFAMDTSVGTDRLHYTPQTSTLSFLLRGTTYTMTPTGLTAGTINVTTLNAGTVNGRVSAGALPLFGASGTAHNVGAVPDPGPTPGTTRFLREDGTWAATGSGGGGVAPGTVNVPLRANLLGEYLLMEGTGTVAHDTSGNGNDGTLGGGGAALPTWNSTGLGMNFGQGVALPPALNAVKTVVMGVYIAPLGNAATHNYSSTPMVVSNTVSNAGFHFLLLGTYPGTTGDFVDSAFGPTLFSAGTITAAPITFSGYHTVAATLGTCGSTVDHLYVDGLEVTTYGAQGCSFGRQTSGNLMLGGSPAVWGAAGGLNGEMYLAEFYSTELNASQIASATGAIQNQVTARGAAIVPTAAPLTYGALNVAGDSITYGYPNLTPYASLLTLANAPTTGVNNWGISGITLDAIAGSEDNRVGPLCKSTTGPAVYTIFSGTNDFVNIQASTPASVFASLASDIQKMKTAGCRVGVVTMISRTGTGYGNNGATLDADKDAYNALILSQSRAAGADFIVDIAADPNFGADGAYANETYFQADGTHPTQVGQQEIANVYSNAYNYTFGHNKANPDVVAAATYPMLSGDGAVSLTAQGAQALTMPDCTGPSGAVYILNNSTAYAKTVVGRANQPINGLTTAIPIAANSSLSLYDVPNPETVSGCHWEY